jgi:2-polyprenyl-3-methyl-5-hydroxy-6-metoxy-1,4-benzoquinol methylase
MNPTAAVERWRRLPTDTDRETYFRVLEAAVREYYLADPTNPFQQSGRSSGPRRWEQTRRFILEAVHRDGDFMDVGCANGLLLESLVGWAREAGRVLCPHGIDFVPELVALAQARFPENRDAFQVANAFDWHPTRRYDFVRTNLEYVPQSDWVPFVRRQFSAVAVKGRLIVCHYRNVDEPRVDPGLVAQQAGLTVAGHAEVPGTAIAWIERTN